MEITFANNKLQRIFSSARELTRVYGEVRGKIIQSRISFLLAAPVLEDVPTSKPFRRHELGYDRKGQFAIDIIKNWRLIFEPINRPLPVKKDGGLNLKKINEIKIIEVEDYHGD